MVSREQGGRPLRRVAPPSADVAAPLAQLFNAALSKAPRVLPDPCLEA